MFSNFFKKKSEIEIEQAYPYFETAQELPGLEATERKRQLEVRQQELQAQAEQSTLSEAEQAEQTAIEAELQDLFKVGQEQTVDSTVEATSPSIAEWVNIGPKIARILLIEDDPDINALLDYMLKREQFEVIRFNNGKAAREWIQSNPAVDLVSLDVMLPQVDGLELIKVIRQQASWKEVPIMMLTSKSDLETVQKALDLGANEYINKPFQPKEYLSRIKRLLTK